MLGLKHARDPADLGPHAGRGHEQLTGSPGHGGVHEGHARPVAQRNIGTVHGGDGLCGRGAFARQRGFVYLQRGGADQPSVGRDHVTSLDGDDVAWHEVGHVDLAQGPSPAHLRLAYEHLLQGRHAGLRLAFLVKAESRVEESQRKQKDAGGELPGQEEADPAGNKKNDLHRIAVLAQKSAPFRLRFGRRKLVAAVLEPPCGDLVHREADLRVDVLRGKGFGRAQDLRRGHRRVGLFAA